MQGGPSVAVAVGDRGPPLSSPSPAFLPRKGPPELFDLTDLYASPGRPPDLALSQGSVEHCEVTRPFAEPPRGWGADGSPPHEHSRPGKPRRPPCPHRRRPRGPCPATVLWPWLSLPAPWATRAVVAVLVQGSHPGWTLPRGHLETFLSATAWRGCFRGY